MLTTRHQVDFPYTRLELDALFRYTHEHDVERGGHDDARSADIHVEILGSVYFDWEPPALWEIDTDEGFSLEDLMRALGRLELQALGYPQHGDVAV